MKTLTNVTRFRVLLLSFLMIGLLPTLTQAQPGQNDPTFNRSDNTPAQGANDSITKSVVLPDDKIIIAGKFTRYNGYTANNLARLKSDGKLDKKFNAGSGVNGNINAIGIQKDKIIIAGDFTSYNDTPINKIARLNTDGSLDKRFTAELVGNEPISNIIIQPDGKILVVKYIDWNTGPLIVRLNKNGSVDNTFHAMISDSLFNYQQIALQPDGKIIVTGFGFGTGNSWVVSSNRLFANGQRDYSFVSEVQIGDVYYPTIKDIVVRTDGKILLGGGFGDSNPYNGMLIIIDPQGELIEFRRDINWINDMVIQKDQKILLAGLETVGPYYEKSSHRKWMMRLNQDFTTDPTFSFFDTEIYFREAVYTQIHTLAIQSNQKIIIGGSFSHINGAIANNIARLNPDGSFDPTFNKRSGCNGTIVASALQTSLSCKQTNEKIIIAGEFSRYNDKVVSNIARLNKDGEFDKSFHLRGGTNGKVYTIAIQSDGKILIGGKFTSYNGKSCGNIARLNADGSLDCNFKTQTDGVVKKISIDKTGKIIIGGNFSLVNGVSKIGVARINSNGTLDNSFNSIITNVISLVDDCIISNKGQIYIAVNSYVEPNSFDFRPEILRLNNDGSLDPLFNFPRGIFSVLNTITINNEGKILVGGFQFYGIGGILQKVAQLNFDGSIDTTFDYLTLTNYLDKPVRTINVLKSGKIVIGGDFTNHIALLNKDGSIDENFSGSADDNVYTTTVVGTEKMIIAGRFSEYTSAVRNSIARIILETNGKKKPKNLESAENGIAANTDIVVYPNPANSEININNLIPGSVIRVYNSLGKEVYTEILTNSSSTIELSNYSNGIYFLTMENNGVKTNKKFIVSK